MKASTDAVDDFEMETRSTGDGGKRGDHRWRSYSRRSWTWYQTLTSGVYFWTRGGLDGKQPNRHVVSRFVDTRLSESLSSFTQVLFNILADIPPA